MPKSKTISPLFWTSLEIVYVDCSEIYFPRLHALFCQLLLGANTYVASVTYILLCQMGNYHDDSKEDTKIHWNGVLSWNEF